MGFGSYDESEQETDDKQEEDFGEDMTAEIKGKEHQGKSTVEDTTEELLELL